MSILSKTERMELTQFTGSLTRFANLYSRYNSDMRKIDAYVASLEDDVTDRLSAMQTDIADFEQRVSDDFTALSTEVNAFDGRITTLEGCCDDVNTVLSNYGSRLNAIELVIDTVSTANIDDLTERVNALENKVEVNTTEIGTLRNDIKDLEERMASAEGVIVQHASAITAVENRVTTLEECCSEVRGVLTEHDTRITQNTTDIRALEDRLTHDEANIAANAQDITIVSNQTAINTQDIQDLKDAFDELDPTSALEVVRQVAVNTQNITNLQSSVNAQAQNLTSLTNRVANDENTISTHTGQIAQLEEDIAQVQSWESRIQAVEAEAQQASADVVTLSGEVSALDTEVQSYDARITANASDISGLDSRLTTVEGKQATDESNFTALEARVAANEADLVAVHQTITNDETGLANVGNRVTALETQNGSVDISAVGSSITDAVDKVNTKAVNANSMATQALSTANTADGKADTAIATANAVETVVGDTNSGLVKDVADNASDISAIQSVIPSDASSANMLLTNSDILNAHSIDNVVVEITASNLKCRNIHNNMAIAIRTKCLELQALGYVWVYVMYINGPTGAIATAEPVNLGTLTSSSNLTFTGDRAAPFSRNNTSTLDAIYHYCMNFNTASTNTCGSTAYTAYSGGITGFAQYSDTVYTGTYRAYLIALKRTKQ